MKKIGRIELIIGPMFAGKTTELLRRIKKLQLANYRCLLVKPDKDQRIQTMESKLFTTTKVQIDVDLCPSLEEISKRIKDYDVIGIIEGQFFTHLSEFAEEFANKGKIIIISALDSTFQRKPFINVIEVIPKCEELTKLSAICVGCGRDAAYTFRIPECDELELIGDLDLYKPFCRTCFQTETANAGR